MAERLICPNCGKASYTAATSQYMPCPYCGFVFSKDGPTRRRRERIRQEVDFTLFYRGRYIPSRTYDISCDDKVDGLRILLDGYHLLREGDILTLDIPALGLKNLRARVVWTSIEGPRTALGLALG